MDYYTYCFRFSPTFAQNIQVRIDENKTFIIHFQRGWSFDATWKITRNGYRLCHDDITVDSNDVKVEWVFLIEEERVSVCRKCFAIDNGASHWFNVHFEDNFLDKKNA